MCVREKENERTCVCGGGVEREIVCFCVREMLPVVAAVVAACACVRVCACVCEIECEREIHEQERERVVSIFGCKRRF